MKKINLTDDEFLRDKLKELNELSEAFEKVGEDIVTRNAFYEKKGFKDSIALRQDCYAVSHALWAASSALCNILNTSANLPSNIERKKKEAGIKKNEKK